MLHYYFVFAAALALEGSHSGKIVVKSRNSQFKVTLPYKAEILKGQLKVNPNSTHYYLVNKVDEEVDQIPEKHWSATTSVPGIRVQQSQAPFKRNVTVKNEFAVPVVVHQVRLIFFIDPPDLLTCFANYCLDLFIKNIFFLIRR